MPFVPDTPPPAAPRGKFVPDAPQAPTPVIQIVEAGGEPAARGRMLEGGLLGEVGLPATATSEPLRGGGVVADMAAEGGGATAGQLLGAMTGPAAPILIPVGGGIGGGIGNYAAQQRRIAAGEQKSFRPGELLSTILTSSIPGAPVAASGGRAVVREGGKQAAAGFAGRNLETLVEEGRLATPTEGVLATVVPAAGGALAQRIQAANPEIQAAIAAIPGKSVKSKTLEAAKELGAAITPSDVTDSWINKRLESIAGPADVRRGAAIKNQQVVNRVAAEELGLPSKTEITIPVLNEVRKKAAKPYEEIGQLAARAKAEIAQIQKEKFTATDPHELAIQMADPDTLKRLAPLELQASADLQALREARDLMNANRPPYPQADAERLKLFRDTQDRVEALEANIEAAAEAAGRPELVKELRESRQLIAKSHDIERALNVGDANVSLPILGRMEDRGRPLSGNLEKLGKFAEAFPRNVTEGARTLPFGLSKTEFLTGSLLAGGGFGATGNPYALLAGIAPPVASSAARRLVLSSPYQRMVAKMPPGKVAAEPDEIAAATRLISQMVAQNAADEDKNKKP